VGADILIEARVGAREGSGAGRGISTVNAYNEGLLLNTLNPATTGSPVVTETAAVVKSGESLIKVTSSASFVVGRQIVLYASGVANCECHTIKASRITEMSGAQGSASALPGTTALSTRRRWST
jgi:hypothetical protein